MDDSNLRLLIGEMREGRACAKVQRLNVLGNPLGNSVKLLIRHFKANEQLRTLCGIDENTVHLELVNVRAPQPRILIRLNFLVLGVFRVRVSRFHDFICKPYE